MSILKIKPIASGSKFARKVIGSVDKYAEINKDGKTSDELLGSTKLVKLPNSIQIERPIMFSATDRRWKLDKYNGNSEDLNDLVKNCKISNDIPGHENYGKLIESADIFDSNDPFFRSDKLVVRLSEGYGEVNTSTPIGTILYLGLKANVKFQEGGDNHNGPTSTRAKYIYVNIEIDKVHNTAKRNLELEVVDLYRNLSEDKMKQLAFYLSLVKEIGDDIDIVKDLLWQYAKSTTKVNNKTKQETFIELCKKDTDEFNSLVLIRKGIVKGVIKQYPDRYECFGRPIGKDLDSSIKYLLNPDNSELFFKLKSAIDIK